MSAARSERVAVEGQVSRSFEAVREHLAAVMARHKPAWEPGTRQAYHGLTLGFFEGELVRRVDPRHRTLGQFFQEEIATPLYTGLMSRPRQRFAPERIAS